MKVQKRDSHREAELTEIRKERGKKGLPDDGSLCPYFAFLGGSVSL
jgi:hypothetical protein